jgi:hypothetical protein
MQLSINWKPSEGEKAGCKGTKDCLWQGDQPTSWQPGDQISSNKNMSSWIKETYRVSIKCSANWRQVQNRLCPKQGKRIFPKDFYQEKKQNMLTCIVWHGHFSVFEHMQCHKNKHDKVLQAPFFLLNNVNSRSCKVVFHTWPWLPPQGTDSVIGWDSKIEW